MNPELKARLEARGIHVRSITPEEAEAMPIIMYLGGPRRPAKASTMERKEGSRKGSKPEDKQE